LLNTSFEQLINLLQEQKKLLTDMLKHSHQIRTIVVGASEERLDSAVRKNLGMIREMKTVGKKQAELLSIVAAELGLGQNEITISAVIAHAGPKERSIVQQLRDELKTGLYELAEMNVINQELIDEHLDYAEIMLEYLAVEDDPLNNFYGNDGGTAPEGARSAGFFDANA